MWERECEVLADELLEVRTTDLLSFFYFVDLEDLIEESVDFLNVTWPCDQGIFVN
jgi:hypothetical protein